MLLEVSDAAFVEKCLEWNDDKLSHTCLASVKSKNSEKIMSRK
jgi:hypothetical protein